MAGLPRRPWRGEAVLVFRRAAYFDDGAGALLAVTGRGLGASPAGLELACEAPGEALGLAAGSTLDFDGATWRLDGRALGAGAVADEPARLPALPRLAVPGPLGPRLDALLPAGAGDAEWAWLRRAAEDLGRPGPGDAALAAAAVACLGRGSGSTPSGDDLLTGWLSGLARQSRHGLPAQRALAARLGDTCRLSRHFLGHALHGRFHRSLARLAALAGVPTADHPLALDLAAQGDRSGRAALAGYLAGLWQGA